MVSQFSTLTGISGAFSFSGFTQLRVCRGGERIECEWQIQRHGAAAVYSYTCSIPSLKVQSHGIFLLPFFSHLSPSNPKLQQFPERQCNICEAILGQQTMPNSKKTAKLQHCPSTSYSLLHTGGEKVVKNQLQLQPEEGPLNTQLDETDSPYGRSSTSPSFMVIPRL